MCLGLAAPCEVIVHRRSTSGAPQGYYDSADALATTKLWEKRNVNKINDRTKMGINKEAKKKNKKRKKKQKNTNEKAKKKREKSE